jgi:hypothetical protein
VLNAVPRNSVWSFVNRLWHKDSDEDISKLCACQFADLWHSGTLSLVLSRDAGGTADCNDVDVIDKSPTGFEDYNFNGPSTYLDGVKDLKGNGQQELTVDRAFLMHHCVATWPVIYAWTGSGYSERHEQLQGLVRAMVCLAKGRMAADERASQEDDGQRPAPYTSVKLRNQCWTLRTFFARTVRPKISVGVLSRPRATIPSPANSLRGLNVEGPSADSNAWAIRSIGSHIPRVVLTARAISSRGLSTLASRSIALIV